MNAHTAIAALNEATTEILAAIAQLTAETVDERSDELLAAINMIEAEAPAVATLLAHAMSMRLFKVAGTINRLDFNARLVGLGLHPVDITEDAVLIRRAEMVSFLDMVDAAFSAG